MMKSGPLKDSTHRITWSQNKVHMKWGDGQMWVVNVFSSDATFSIRD